MRSGLVISKRRIVDWCIAKGDDNRTFIDDTDPLNPITAYPVFRFRVGGIEILPNESGVLDVRSTIIRSGEIMKTITQRFSVSISGYIGDNSQRSAYPTGLLELYLRVPRWQLDKLSQVNFRYGGFGGGSNTQYFTSYIDISKLKNVKGIKTVDNTSVNNRIGFLNLGVNPNMEYLLLYNISTTSIDISNMPLLRRATLGTTYNNLNSITTSGTYNNLTTFEAPGGNLITIPDLDSNSLVSLQLNNNLISGSISFSSKPYKNTLTTLNLGGNSGINSIDLSDAVNLVNCYLNGIAFGSGTSIVGLENLSKLRILYINSSAVSNLKLSSPFTLSNYPNLRELDASGNGGLTFDVSNIDDTPSLQYLRVNETGAYGELNGNINNNLTSIYIGNTNITYFNSAKYPNVRLIHISSGFNSIVDFSSLTRIDYFYVIVNNTHNGSGVLDFSGVTTSNMGNSTFTLRDLPLVTEIKLPSIQVSNNVFNLNSIYNNNNLTTITGLNSISRNNTIFSLLNTKLSVLDTSFGGGTCFPNVTQLALGGNNDTYTSTAVYDFRKNNVSTLHIRGSAFQTSGSIGTDTCAVATFLDIAGDADLSFATIGGFGTTMRRVYLRPKTGSGLAIDSDQVANLIIYLSSKTWTTSTATIGIGGVNYAPKVIDLRGNCAVPTPSTALTNALTLLTTTKGITVLTN